MKKWKKCSVKFLMILSMLLINFSIPVFALTDNYPTNAPIAGGVYIQANVTVLGNVIIYVPIEYKDGYFSYLQNTTNIINISNSTITCNLYAGNNYQTYYQARFSRFGTLEYYYNYSGSSYRWEPIAVSSIQNTNVNIVDNTTINAIRQVSIENIIDITVVLLLGMVLIILIIKRN